MLDSDIENLGNSVVLIAYIAGYSIHSVCKRSKCDICKFNFTTDKDLNIHPSFKLIHMSDRGGLKYPTDEIIAIAAYNFIILQKLIEEKYENLFFTYT